MNRNSFGTTPLNHEQLQDYQRLRESRAYCRLSGRTQIEISGTDRASFLHNLCTNDIRRLQPNSGCEAFLTNVQGKILAHVQVFCRETSLLIDTVPDQAGALINHLDRYRIRENVSFLDQTADVEVLSLVSSESRHKFGRLSQISIPEASCGHLDVVVEGINVQVRSLLLAGEHWTFMAYPVQESKRISSVLNGHGFAEIDLRIWNTCRVECGWPGYQTDISLDNFPHEVNRVPQTVSFVKGCYLGQETVARIDALGHVNWLLAKLKFSVDAIPSDTTELTAADAAGEGKAIARLRSTVWSPRCSCPMALAYVRREQIQQGNRINTNLGEVEVLPLDSHISPHR